MERLTWKDESGYYASKNVTLNALKQRGELVDRLAAYEDLEEKGRLVVHPCKVGDTVYIVDRGKILEEEVIGFSTFNAKSGETITAMTASYGYYVTRPNINDLGVLHRGNRLSFFFTRDEAEKALKGVSEDA